MMYEESTGDYCVFDGLESRTTACVVDAVDALVLCPRGLCSDFQWLCLSLVLLLFFAIN